MYKKFDNCVIGFSDHTTDNLVSFGAVALGASILERHFTDDMKREGPDIINLWTLQQPESLLKDQN